MISVRKNYTEPPPILSSDLCKAAVEDILRRKALLGHPNMTLLLNSDLLYKLEETYKGKCAFCEKKISVAHSSLLVSHYRPYNHYYWLTYEWSNLFPTCEDCFTFRENIFPVAHDENRFLSPPQDTNLWNSAYALKEIPLMLNPEIDATDAFFYFDIDGKIKPHNQHIRAQTSINVFRLNQGYGVIGRKKKINHFIHLFHEKLKDFLSEFEDGKHEKTQAQQFFGGLIADLILSAQPEAEYSLLGKDMIKNFDYYFIQTLENSLQKETLEAAFYSCLSLKANSAAKKIVMQTDDKQTEQYYSFEKIVINNIKCFDEITIKYAEENQKNVLLLVGSNGSGKSSILQLAALAFAGVHKPPADYAWEGVIKDEQKKADFHIHTKQNDGDEVSVMRFEIDHYDIIHCKSNKDFYDSVRRLTLVLAYGSGRNLGKSDGLRYKNFEGIASLFGENRFLKSLNDEHTQVIVSEQFELLKTLINRIIQKIYQRDEFHLESFSSRDFYFKTSTGGFTTLNSLSDGFQTIFSWFFDMLIRMEEANY